jgi:hypothetical protein
LVDLIIGGFGIVFWSSVAVDKQNVVLSNHDTWQ